MKIIVIIAIINFVFASTQNCIIVDNVVFMWSIENETVSIELGQWNYMKWLAVGFNHKNSTMKGASIYLFFENQLYEYYGTEFGVKPILVRQVEWTQKSIEKRYGDLKIEFKIPLINYNFNFSKEEQRLLIAYNIFNTPKSPIDIEKHTHAFTRNLNFFQPGL